MRSENLKGHADHVSETNGGERLDYSDCQQEQAQWQGALGTREPTACREIAFGSDASATDGVER
jgi:hypothetical protein